MSFVFAQLLSSLRGSKGVGVCMFCLTTHNGSHRFKPFNPGESGRRWGEDLAIEYFGDASPEDYQAWARAFQLLPNGERFLVHPTTGFVIERRRLSWRWECSPCGV